MRYAGAQGRKPVRAKAGAGNRGNMELPEAPRGSPQDPRTNGYYQGWATPLHAIIWAFPLEHLLTLQTGEAQLCLRSRVFRVDCKMHGIPAQRRLSCLAGVAFILTLR